MAVLGFASHGVLENAHGVLEGSPEMRPALGCVLGAPSLFVPRVPLKQTQSGDLAGDLAGAIGRE